MPNYTTVTSDRSKNVALICCLLGFVGLGGIHQFYVGKIFWGILYLITGGFLFVGTILDLISILIGAFKDNTGAPLRQ